MRSVHSIYARTLFLQEVKSKATMESNLYYVNGSYMNIHLTKNKLNLFVQLTYKKGSFPLCPGPLSPVPLCPGPLSRIPLCFRSARPPLCSRSARPRTAMFQVRQAPYRYIPDPPGPVPLCSRSARPRTSIPCIT